MAATEIDSPVRHWSGKQVWLSSFPDPCAASASAPAPPTASDADIEEPQAVADGGCRNDEEVTDERSGVSPRNAATQSRCEEVAKDPFPCFGFSLTGESQPETCADSNSTVLTMAPLWDVATSPA